MRITDKYTLESYITAKRNGVELAQLQAEGIVITMSAVAEIKTSMSCFIHYREGIKLLSDRLCPIQVVNGVHYPMGEFVVAAATPNESLGKKGWLVEAYDLDNIVKQTSVQSSYYKSGGTPYTEIVQELLLDCGINRAIIQPSSLALAESREWEIGTDYLTIINTLLKEINYNSLWFDRNGVARAEPYKEQGAGEFITYQPDAYSTLLQKATASTDAYTAYNVFTVVVSSPDLPPMVATAVNDSPVSPVSTVNRGRRICAPVEYLESIPDQSSLELYAKHLVMKSMQGYETVEFETLPVPEHWYDNSIILEGSAYKETGWEITLGYGGTYIHTAKKMVML